MLYRTIGLLVAVVMLCLLSVYMFGEAVLVWLGAVANLAKAQLGKLSFASLRAALPVLKNWFIRQFVGFAQKGLVRRWFRQAVVPMLLGAAARRFIDRHKSYYLKHLRVRRKLLWRWHRRQPRPVQLALSISVMLAILWLSVVMLGTWVVWFAVRVPAWVTGFFSRMLGMVSRSLQKTVFKVLAATHIFKLIDWLWEKLPTGWHERYRRFNRRWAREWFRYRRRAILRAKKLPSTARARRRKKPCPKQTTSAPRKESAFDQAAE